MRKLAPVADVDQFLRDDCGISLLHAREDLDFPGPVDVHTVEGDIYRLADCQRWLDAWIVMYRAMKYASHSASQRLKGTQ